ncbi:MAG: hypothetical protein JO071_06930 [Deltaproteobacteria bacterium]|nr:hypothetical protein [Deltaproteobacteria bacterium]
MFEIARLQFDLPTGPIGKRAPTGGFDSKTLTLTKFKLYKIDVLSLKGIRQEVRVD